MHTRMLTFRGATDIDGGVTYLRNEALPMLAAQNGVRGVSASGNRSTHVLGILSLWETEEARAASDSAMGKTRKEAVEIVGGNLTVENFEETVSVLVEPVAVGCSVLLTRASMDPADVDQNVAFFKSDVIHIISSQQGFCALRHMIDRATGEDAVGSIWGTQQARDAFAAMQPERRKTAEPPAVRFGEQETREVFLVDIT